MATFQIYLDKSREYRWRLRATNSEIVADSAEGYKDKRDCLRGIEIVKTQSPGAGTEDLTG